MQPSHYAPLQNGGLFEHRQYALIGEEGCGSVSARGWAVCGGERGAASYMAGSIPWRCIEQDLCEAVKGLDRPVCKVPGRFQVPVDAEAASGTGAAP